jgi:hypothetical protein
VPLDLGVLISLPLYGIALRERLRSRPVRIVFDWLCEIFSEKNHWFRREFKPEDLPPTSDALRLLSTSHCAGAGCADATRLFLQIC